MLKPVLGGVTPSPESVRALASLFGGGTGFVSHDVILGLVRVPQSVLTNRLYSLFPRHTLEELFQLLANVKNRVRVRTPRSATTTAKTLTEKEARLEFAFELYDLDGDGLVTEAELVEVVHKTMKGNTAKMASTLRIAMDEHDNNSNASSTDGPSFNFHEFKKLADRVPSLLFPVQTLYELLVEFGGNAGAVLSALRELDSSNRYRNSGSSSLSTSRNVSTGNLSTSRGGSQRGSPRKTNSNALDESEARKRCASMSKQSLVNFLETLGMNLGLELMSRDELVDLAAAGALSTGRTKELPEGVSGNDSPRSSPRHSRKQSIRPARAPLATNLADTFADRASEIVFDAFRAARMGRGDVLEQMIRGGDVGLNAVDKTNENNFTLLMSAAMSGMTNVCKRLLQLGGDVSAVDTHGRTALDLALTYKHNATADYLARKGVPLSSRGATGESPMPNAPPAPSNFGDDRDVSNDSPNDTGIVSYGDSTSPPGSDPHVPSINDEGPLLSPE